MVWPYNQVLSGASNSSLLLRVRVAPVKNWLAFASCLVARIVAVSAGSASVVVDGVAVVALGNPRRISTRAALRLLEQLVHLLTHPVIHEYAYNDSFSQEYMQLCDNGHALALTRCQG